MITIDCLRQGCCLEVLKDLRDQSIDTVICDPPYGTTTCKWDAVIPFEPLWAQLKRVCKETTAFFIFGSEPFSSVLRLSNIKQYKYDWIWKKDKATGHLNSKKQPMRQTENISVFYNKQPVYNPQFYEKNAKNIRPETKLRNNTDVYGSMNKQSQRVVPLNIGYPKNILEFNSCVENGDKGFHPTQKPVDLMKYLIKTYTNENEWVLDFTMGSGTTGVACKNTNRNFIGIEKDPDYFEIAKKRILEC